jgi:hypothetical protein
VKLVVLTLFLSLSSVCLAKDWWDFSALSEDELDKLETMAQFSYGSNKLVEGSLYNGNEFRVKNVMVEVTYVYAGVESSVKQYKLLSSYGFSSRASTNFSVFVFPYDSNRKKFVWYIKVISAEKD